jgi:hypothetical protein
LQVLLLISSAAHLYQANFYFTHTTKISAKITIDMMIFAQLINDYTLLMVRFFIALCKL